MFVTADAAPQTGTVRIRRPWTRTSTVPRRQRPGSPRAAASASGAPSGARAGSGAGRGGGGRARGRRRLRWVCAPVVLPIAGAAATAGLLDREGGDLTGWSTRSVVLAVVLLFGVPAAITVWLARRRGPFEALGWAAITVLAQIALVFWVGLVALGIGPD